MELKTDKIHRILNTPYDELSPQDFAVAQEQLDVLVVGTRDKQIDAFQFLENKLVCERDAARAERDQLAQTATANAETLRMTEREHAVTVDNLETALTGTKAERGALEKRIAHLEAGCLDLGERLRKAEKERDQLDDELTDLRQAPSGTAKQAERIRELEDKMRLVVDDHAKQVAGLEHAIGVLRLDVERKNAGLVQVTADLAELEQAKVQAANAAAMVVSITAERDAAQAAELKALRLLAAERADIDRALDSLSGRLESLASVVDDLRIDPDAVALSTDGSAFAKFAAKETAAAHEAMDKRQAELDTYGYGRPPGTPPPATITGLVPPPPIRCDMPTPDGRCAEQAFDIHGHNRFCKRHLDEIRK